MAVVAGYSDAVITDRQLEAIGQDFRDWLLAHKDAFPPLKIVDVRYQEDQLLDETIISLTVLWDASGLAPDEGFSVDAYQALLRAVGQHQAEGDFPVPVYVHMEDTGSDDEDVDDDGND